MSAVVALAFSLAWALGSSWFAWTAGLPTSAYTAIGVGLFVGFWAGRLSVAAKASYRGDSPEKTT